MRQLPSAPRDPSRTAYAVGCNRVAQSVHLLPMKVRPLVPITILRDGAGPRESGGCSRRRRPAFVANRLVTGVFHVIDQCSSVCWLEGTIAVLGSGRMLSQVLALPISTSGRRACFEGPTVRMPKDLRCRQAGVCHLTAGSETGGSCTVTESPPPGRGVRVRLPSCAWVMLLTIASPRPRAAWSVCNRLPRR